jgi:uncharacterized protein (TIGR00369 family)
MMAESDGFNFLEFIGTKVEYFNKDEAVLSLELQKHHQQHLGYVHGGVISTMADNTGWFVVKPYLDEDQTVVTQELSINYLRPARGSFLRCVGQMIKKGQKSVFVSAEVFCDDVLVAFATSHLSILDTPYNAS